LKPPSFETLYCTAEIDLLADALPHIYTPALKRVVAFTSTSIVTKIDSEVASERELLQRLAEGERRLIATCEHYRVGWTILRPTVIYAEGRDGNVSRLARLSRRFGVLPLMGNDASSVCSPKWRRTAEVCDGNANSHRALARRAGDPWIARLGRR
jgi:hypothetical protein